MNRYRPAWLVVVAMLYPATLSGQVNSWQALGPEGGSVAAIVQDPANVNTLYAVIDEAPSRVYRSTDHGATWVLRGSVATTYSGNMRLAVDPAAPSRLFLAASNSLYRSTDAGQQWTNLSTPVGVSLWHVRMESGSSLTIHGIGGHWENSTTYPVYHKSTDGGNTWRTTNIISEEGSPVMLDAAGAVVFVSVYRYTPGTYELYRSTDGGASFVEKTGSIGEYMLAALVDPATPSRVWVSSYAGVYRTTDTGETWTLSAGYVFALSEICLKPGSPASLIGTGYFDGIFTSTDAGVNWTLQTSGLYGNGGSGLVVEALPSNTVFNARNAGIFRSSDGGKNWQPSSTGIAASRVVTVRMAPSQPSVVYAAVDDDAVYKTAAIGALPVIWQRLGNFMHCGYVNDIAVSPADAGKAYAVGGT